MSGGEGEKVALCGSNKQVYDSDVYGTEDKTSYVSSLLPAGEDTDDEQEQPLARYEFEPNSRCCNKFVVLVASFSD